MHAPDLPVPPPFMWTCCQCTDWLTELSVAHTLAKNGALYDGAARCQLLLAHHLATRHSGDIPGPHQDCPQCDYYEKWAGKQGIDDLWLEHRARGLFLPPDEARLL